MRGPYRLSGTSEQAVCATLRSDVMWMRRYAADARQERVRLIAELRDVGLEPLESKANFVLVPVGDARALQEELLARGIRVRAFAGLPRVGDAIRITVGPRSMMERTVRALSALPSGVTR